MSNKKTVGGVVGGFIERTIEDLSTMSSPPCLMYFKRYSLWLLTMYISKAPPRSLRPFPWVGEWTFLSA